MTISIKLVYQYVAIFFNFPPTSSYLHPVQVENCDSTSRLVVDEDDNDKFRPERVNYGIHPAVKLTRIGSDAGRALNQQWFKVSCLLDSHHWSLPP